MKREQIIKVEVLTLNKKIASQIQIATVSDVKQLDVESGDFDILGWTHVDAVFSSARLGTSFMMLIKVRGRLLWHTAFKDDRHEIWGIYGVEQLFIK